MEENSIRPTATERLRRFVSGHRVPVIAGAVALAVVTGTAGTGLYCYQRTEEAQAAEARHLVMYANEQDLVDETMAEARTMLDGDENGEGAVTAEQVADPATLDTLRAVLDAHEEAARVEPRDSSHGSFDNIGSALDYLTFWDVERSCEDNEEKRSHMEDERQAVRTAIFDVETSERQRDVSNAHDALADAISSAKGSLDSVRGEVSDDATVKALEEQLEAAEAARDCDISGIRYASQSECDAQVAAYDDARSTLADAQTKAEDSHADWQTARRHAAAYASQQAAQRAAQRTGGYASQGSDGTWYVSYRGTDDPTTANADGSTSEWMDGYYIAHSWSSGGQMIASKPNTVVVDGRTYRYVSSITVPQSTTWDEVSGFVYANGGIGFQTCVGGGNVIITHYEPV